MLFNSDMMNGFCCVTKHRFIFSHLKLPATFFTSMLQTDRPVVRFTCLLNLVLTLTLQAGSSMYDRCDVFGFRNQYSHVLLIEGLMRFLETENKLKRVSVNSYSRRDALMNLVYLAATRDPLSIFFNAVVDDHREFLPSSSPAAVMRNPVADKTIETAEEPLVPESLASLAEVDPDELDQRLVGCLVCNVM